MVLHPCQDLKKIRKVAIMKPTDTKLDIKIIEKLLKDIVVSSGVFRIQLNIYHNTFFNYFCRKAPA